MSEVKNMKVKIIDDDHIYVDNRQFISLKRFDEARKEVAEEMKLAADKNKELAEENEALKVLLKNQLNDVAVIDDSSVKRLTNKTCESESDHEWECCGMSTEGSHYMCKKCGTHRMFLCNTGTLDVHLTTLNI